MLKVTPFIYKDIDDLKANTYVITDSFSNCVVVDPSSADDGIVRFIRKNGLCPKAVFLTHGHIDHIRGVDRLAEAFGIPVLIEFEDEPILQDGELNFADELGEKTTVRTKPVTFSDREILNYLEEPAEVIHTPYHTLGSSCFYFRKSGLLFSGDSLFHHGIGRYDLKNSCRKKIYESLAKLGKLPDDVKVYPGHGEFTDISSERKGNPFIK